MWTRPAWPNSASGPGRASAWQSWWKKCCAASAPASSALTPCLPKPGAAAKKATRALPPPCKAGPPCWATTSPVTARAAAAARCLRPSRRCWRRRTLPLSCYGMATEPASPSWPAPRRKAFSTHWSIATASCAPCRWSPPSMAAGVNRSRWPWCASTCMAAWPRRLRGPCPRQRFSGRASRPCCKACGCRTQEAGRGRRCKCRSRPAARRWRPIAARAECGAGLFATTRRRTCCAAACPKARWQAASFCWALRRRA